MTRLDVTGWQLTALTDVPDAARGPLPATVPGCVHTDLLAAGVIDDPYLGQNELSAPWIGRADWQYRGTFTVTAEMLEAEHLTLVCDGLDTVAEVSVNGESVARTESMHVGYRFEIRDRVRGGKTNSSSSSAPLTPTPRQSRKSWASCQTPTRSRLTLSARWRATSAGTGVRRW